MKLYDIAGWSGVTLIISAYALLTISFLKVEDVLYIFMNIIGSAFIIWSSYSKRDFQPVVLNMIWLCIAGIGLMRVML